MSHNMCFQDLEKGILIVHQCKQLSSMAELVILFYPVSLRKIPLSFFASICSVNEEQPIVKWCYWDQRKHSLPPSWNHSRELFLIMVNDVIKIVNCPEVAVVVGLEFAIIEHLTVWIKKYGFIKKIRYLLIFTLIVHDMRLGWLEYWHELFPKENYWLFGTDENANNTEEGKRTTRIIFNIFDFIL